MLFSSIPFLYYFLPAVLAVYFLVPRGAKNGVLLVSSLIFYGWGEPRYLLLMAGTILLFYLCGLAMGRAETARRKKLLLWISVAVGIALWNMDSLLRAILASQVFTHENVRKLRLIRWCCFAVAVICIPAACFYYPLVFMVLVMGFLSLAVTVVVRVMAAAVALREENDLTI